MARVADVVDDADVAWVEAVHQSHRGRGRRGDGPVVQLDLRRHAVLGRPFRHPGQVGAGGREQVAVVALAEGAAW